MRNISLLAFIFVSTFILSGSHKAIAIDNTAHGLISQKFGYRLVRRHGGSVGMGDSLFNKRYPAPEEVIVEVQDPKDGKTDDKKPAPKDPNPKAKDPKEPAKEPEKKKPKDDNGKKDPKNNQNKQLDDVKSKNPQDEIQEQKDKSEAAKVDDPATAEPVGNAPSVKTDGLSPPAIIALASIGVVIFAVTGLFAFVRKKKHKKMTNNIVTSSSTAWEQQNSHEKLDEEIKPIGSYTVIATYTPALADELDIQPGDKVTILVEYDDGWVQGINETRGGTKGVFPRHCVDMNTALNNKRSSSIGGYTVVDLN